MMGAHTLKFMSAAKFLSGKPCKRGHTGYRLVSSRACCECAKEKNAQRYETDGARILESVRAYRSANPEKARQSRIESDARNRELIRQRDRERFVGERREKSLARLAKAASAQSPEKKRARVAAWAKANPGKCTAASARRRAGLMQRTPSWADHDLMNSIYELARIYREFGHEVEVDHAVPLRGRRVSGLHVHDNLQIINSLANKSKCNHFAVH